MIDVFVSHHIDPDIPLPSKETVGAKAAGLFEFPILWTPPFIAIGTSLNRVWRKASKREKSKLARAVRNIVEEKLEPVSYNFIRSPNGYFVRSSASGEDIRQRGQLNSQHFKALHLNALVAFLDTLLGHHDNGTGDIGLVIQVATGPERRIHLSNERRFSKTKNEWVIAQEVAGSPHVPQEGCNSIKARILRENKEINLRRGEVDRDIRAMLRAVGRWANSKYSSRVHFEAIVSESRLFLVQVDAEIDSGGIDPKDINLDFSIGDPDAVNVFSLYRKGDKTEFQKLTNISEFSCAGYEPPHRLFYATANTINDALKLNNGNQLQEEIFALTADRLVLREDRDPALRDIPGYNLFRTDTVTSTQALDVLKKRIKHWKDLKCSLHSICFILHAFIPARAGAWAMYNRQEGRVRIHALWGLPDGLQFLTPDEYEYDLATDNWSERVHFKEFFLRERSDGTWERQPVALNVSRTKVLPISQANEIARLSVAIANALNTDVHIMFFCGVPKELGLGEVLPWYRAHNVENYEAKREKRRRRVFVRTVDDLNNIEKNRAIIISLAPEIENYRDNNFLKKVANFARKNNIPVEIQGSPLAHAYYILRKEKCTVFTSFAPAYERIRKKREFGKLVRDDIVARIGGGGEKSVSFKLPPNDRGAAFFGKLIEEGLEVLRAQTNDEKLEELADLFEVVHSWIKDSAFEFSEIEVAAEHKRQRIGGFSKYEVLVETGSKSVNIDTGTSSTLIFDYITRSRIFKNGVAIPAGRLGLIARGETCFVDIGNSGLKLEMSMSEDGDLMMRTIGAIDAMRDDQLELGLIIDHEHTDVGE